MPDTLEEAAGTLIAVDITPESERRRKVTPREKTDTRKEPNYHVVIWNDEEHTYEYVVELLTTLFNHTAERALKITTEVDKAGKGIAWTGHRELAELKCEQVLNYGPDWRMASSKSSIRATIEAAPE